MAHFEKLILREALIFKDSLAIDQLDLIRGRSESSATLRTFC